MNSMEKQGLAFYEQTPLRFIKINILMALAF